MARKGLTPKQIPFFEPYAWSEPQYLHCLLRFLKARAEARPNWLSGGLGASGVGGVAHYLAVGGAEAGAWCWALASEADAWYWALALWRAKYLWCCCMRMDVDRRLRHRAALHA